ncbi:MAG: hypothetical protein DRR11_06950 [Gammaproteobacteria bacterium]|nr:MAG: hypothetical protein DRR15_19605 [Gammaproteobacteria bacterium]RLA32912.1 MAG: hypothetical protein DRR11_06950 [Gammaproteobacteria bacterium]
MNDIELGMVTVAETRAVREAKTVSWQRALHQYTDKMNGYQLATRSGVADLTSPQNLSEDKLNLAIYNSVRYMDDITNM